MATATIPAVDLPSGETIPVMGQSTCRLAQGDHPRKDEITALQTGIDLGMTLVTTSEAIGAGAAEELVGEAISGRRDDVFLVGETGVRAPSADRCGESLRRLRTDRFDLYLMRASTDASLEDGVAALEELRRDGLIRHWGVDGFGLQGMTELLQTGGGEDVQADAMRYSLLRRDIDWALVPWAAQIGLPILAYAPLDGGELVGHPVLRGIGVRHHRATSVQVALAWVLRHPRVIALPGAGTPEHVRANRDALDVDLDEDDVLELETAFPPPQPPAVAGG